MPVIEYDRSKAVAYAHRWAYDRNPRYYDYSRIGGDCTNFASQVLYAGTGVMNYTPTFGWYYIDANNKSPSWTGVVYFYNFLISNKGLGPFGREVDVSQVQPGDFVQLAFNYGRFQHTPVIVQTGNPPSINNILVAAHSDDADYRPLNSYIYTGIRFIHILGARK